MGRLTLDLRWGRSVHPLGPITFQIEAPRDLVFEIITARTRAGPRAAPGSTSSRAATSSWSPPTTRRSFYTARRRSSRRAGWGSGTSPARSRTPSSSSSSTSPADAPSSATREVGIDFFVLGRLAARHWVRPSGNAPSASTSRTSRAARSSGRPRIGRGSPGALTATCRWGAPRNRARASLGCDPESHRLGRRRDRHRLAVRLELDLPVAETDVEAAAAERAPNLPRGQGDALDKRLAGRSMTHTHTVPVVVSRSVAREGSGAGAFSCADPPPPLLPAARRPRALGGRAAVVVRAAHEPDHRDDRQHAGDDHAGDRRPPAAPRAPARAPAARSPGAGAIGVEAAAPRNRGGPAPARRSGTRRRGVGVEAELLRRCGGSSARRRRRGARPSAPPPSRSGNGRILVRSVISSRSRPRSRLASRSRSPIPSSTRLLSNSRASTAQALLQPS